MALRDESKMTTQTTEKVAQEQQQQNVNQTASFDDDDFGATMFLVPGTGSEYLNKFIEKAKEVPAIKEPLVKKGVEIRTRLFKLDKDTQFQDLPYSYVIVATQASNSPKVYFHVILLEATGRKPVQIAHILEEIKFKRSSLIYVAADTFADTYLQSLIKRVLMDAYGTTEDNLRPTEGLVVPHDQDPEQVGIPATVVALNNNLAKLYIENSVLNYLDLRTYTSKIAQKQGQLVIDTTFNMGVFQNAVGKPIRTDFELDLVAVFNRAQSLIGGNIRKPQTTEVGYLEYLPDMIANIPGQPPRTMIMPLVILNEFHAFRPTAEMILLNIINSSIFNNQSMHYQLLMNVPRDLGVLNVLTKTVVDPKTPNAQFGKKIKLKDGKLNENEVLNFLANAVEFEKAFAVEVEYYGPNFGIEAPFAALAVPGAAEAANEEIIAIAESLTGHAFANRQVAASTIVVPVGEWIDNTGTKRDIREVDLAYVLEHAKDMDLVLKWIDSNAPAHITGKDPYLLKLEVINALIPNAVITGKAVRVTLNGAFYKELVEAAIAAGLNPRADIGKIEFTSYSNLQAVAAAYAGAKVGGVNFGYAGPQGPQFAMPGMGMFGYGS